MSTSNNISLSVLDLSPVPSGSSSKDALLNTLDLAKHCDELGYNRYWLAEHHNTLLIASSAPEIMIGHVASITKRIRVGSGGVMLPNHSPLKVAENFRMLEALHPSRIDLGIGRAPGTDQKTALALRRSPQALLIDDFPEQLNDLLTFFSGTFPDNHPYRRIRAIPEGVPAPEIWLLGSSDFSARLAAELGLGFAFAHHINPWPAVQVCRLYQNLFRPSVYLTEPKTMLAISVICSKTVEEAEELALSTDLTLLKLPLGKLKNFPSIAEAKAYPYDQQEQQIVHYNRSRFFVGSPALVHKQICDLAEQAGVNELMVTTMAHEHQARRKSYKLLADAFCLSV